MTVVQTVTKNVIHRAWSDIEPKVITFLATGLSAGVIVEAATYLGYPIDPGLALVISTIVASVFGYIKSSTTKAVAFGNTTTAVGPLNVLGTTNPVLPAVVVPAPVAPTVPAVIPAPAAIAPEPPAPVV